MNSAAKSIDERNAIIEQNEKLMYWAAARAMKKFPQFGYDELLSAAGYALVKAAAAYDGSRRASFSSFYLFVYQNETLMLFRRKKGIQALSLDTPLSAGNSDSEFVFLRDIIPGPDNTENTAITIMDIARVMAQIDRLPPLERACILACIDGANQCETAAKIGASQASVSRATRRAQEKLRNTINGSAPAIDRRARA